MDQRETPQAEKRALSGGQPRRAPYLRAMLLDERPAFSYQSDPGVPDFDDQAPLAVMDASCGLCAKGARWIARNDWRGEFRIAPIRSDLGRALARHYGIDPEDPATWLIVADGRGLSGFDAVFWAAERFGGGWALLGLLKIAPRAVRARLYSWVARNRYRFFGRTELCALPDPAVQARLLRDAPAP